MESAPADPAVHTPVPADESIPVSPAESISAPLDESVPVPPDESVSVPLGESVSARPVPTEGQVAPVSVPVEQGRSQASFQVVSDTRTEDG